MVFLMETKIRKNKMEIIRCKLHFENMFVVDSVGKSGGMALFWGEEVSVRVQNFSHRHIGGLVSMPGLDEEWLFTGFYGHPEPQKRFEAWALLEYLARHCTTAWVCIGDFNEVVDLSEIWGGRGRARSQMVAFQNALECSNLDDLGFMGPKYTWNNCREGLDFTKERLDRGVANPEWRNLYPDAEIQVDVTTCSDHFPLTLSLAGDISGEREKRCFRYEAKWALDMGYDEVVKKAWIISKDGRWAPIEENLKRCQWGFKSWQRGLNGNLHGHITNLQQRLSDLHGQEEKVEMGNEIKATKEELQSLMDKQDLQWQQRAKMDWLRCGDRNTKYYHACANYRRKTNRIAKIVDGNGAGCETEVEIKNAFINYFEDLFTSGHVGDISLCLQPLERRVSNEMNAELLKPFTGEEVYRALFQMAPLKAPGPDGFSAGFFQKNWSVMGEDICQAILGILNSGTMPLSLNSTNIALIPKVKNPSNVSEFRPISLCNVLYKLVSKVLANRLKKILHILISPIQSAFIPGRLITDNVLAAYETLHTMHSRMRGKKGFMAVKLDMSKAYDRVEWSFLEVIMKRMGFAPQWIHLMMMCVTTVSYAVVINGNPCGRIIPKRGLRQGDPISPYLFLLCAEALSALLYKANGEGVLTGVPTSKRGPRMSHLFFADDSLLFCRANIAQWNSLANVLKIYEDASGQRLNNNKTSLFFSKNTPLADKEAIMALSGLQNSQNFDAYLGLPAMVGKSRTAAFRSIIDRVWRRLQDWKLKFLSQAGKEILLKAVVQAIPSYCMSVFLLPKGLCMEINSLMKKFWWGNHGSETRVHWMKWEKMGRSKNVGGMGFRDFRSFNKALLAKQCWRLWKQPDSLVGKIMKAKYFPNHNVLDATLGKRPSFAWRSIFSSCDLLKEGLVWRVGNGEKVRIWKDKWIPSSHYGQIYTPPSLLDEEATVSNLIDADTKGWKTHMLESLFAQDEVQMIKNIPLSCTNQEDIQIWRGTKNGIFTVRSAYHIQQDLLISLEAGSSNVNERHTIWKELWAMQVPNAEKNFLWRACHDILPTRENLHKRKIIDDPMCPICGREVETSFHILWQCPSAMDVWSMGNLKFQKSAFKGPCFSQVVAGMFSKCSPEEIQQFVGLARRIWLRRNEVVHGGMFTHPSVIMQITRRAIADFQAAHEKQAVQNTSSGLQGTRWEAPQFGWLKANWDAGYNKAQGCTGFGVVVRDSSGTLIAAKCAYRQGFLVSSMAEILGALTAVQLCRSRGFMSVHFEGDAQEAVDAINSTAWDLSHLGHLAADVKTEMQGLLQWKVTHVRRNGNTAAHILSKFAAQYALDRTWCDDLPECIKETISLEKLALAF
jgi:ribonuclease HI